MPSLAARCHLRPYDAIPLTGWFASPTFALGQKMAWQNGDAALPGGFSNAKAV